MELESSPNRAAPSEREKNRSETEQLCVFMLHLHFAVKYINKEESEEKNESVQEEEGAAGSS